MLDDDLVLGRLAFRTSGLLALAIIKPLEAQA